MAGRKPLIRTCPKCKGSGLLRGKEPVKSDPIPMACAACGSDKVFYVDEERVACRECNWTSDPYEAMKAAEKQDGKEAEAYGNSSTQDGGK